MTSRRAAGRAVCDDTQPPAVQVRARAALGGEQLVLHRVVDGARHHLAVHGQRHRASRRTDSRGRSSWCRRAGRRTRRSGSRCARCRSPRSRCRGPGNRARSSLEDGALAGAVHLGHEVDLALVLDANPAVALLLERARRAAPLPSPRHVPPAQVAPSAACDCRMRARANAPPAALPRRRAASRALPRAARCCWPWSPRCCSSAWARCPSSAPTSRATRASRSRCSARGDWVTPTLQGRAVAGEAGALLLAGGRRLRVLGETEAAARLPSVLAALLLVGRHRSRGGAALRRAAPACTPASCSARALLLFVYGRAAAWTCCWPPA